MTVHNLSRFFRALLGALGAPLVLSACLLNPGTASATPLNFSLFNASSSNQSRLDLSASGTLTGGTLQSSPQFAPGGSNGKGSLSTLYDDRPTTDSKLLTNVTQHNISFTGGSTAVANNTVNNANNNFNLKPNIGGASGTAPGDYGVHFTSPQEIVIPPIDLGGGTMVNLGTLTTVNVDVALRDVVVDVLSGSVPLIPFGSYPQIFDASQLNIGMSGNADTLFGAVLKQGTPGDWLAATVALNALKTQLADQGYTNVTVTSNFFQLTNTVSIGVTSAIPLTFTANEDATNGLLEHIGSKFQLTVPVKFTVVPELPSGLDALLSMQLGLSGKLIGQADFANVDVPEPSSVVLGGLALVGLVGMVVRRRRG